MKPKKFDRRLSLKKETIANLHGSEMVYLKGGCGLTDVNSGCIYSEYTCLAQTCPTNCGVTCGGLTCQGTYPDCPCYKPIDI